MSELTELDEKHSSGIKELKKRLETLQEHIDDCGAMKSDDEQKKEIMGLLHKFNDIKDATQVVLGTLANIEGVTIKDMHLRYNLPLD